MGWRAFGNHVDTMKSNLPVSLKRKGHSQCVLPMYVTCDSETLHLIKGYEREQKSAERGMERKMLGATTYTRDPRNEQRG